MRETTSSAARERPWPKWRQEVEDSDTTSMGRAPETRGQMLVKLMWIGIWLLYLGSPVSDLASGHHNALVTTLAGCGLLAFVVSYLAVVFLRTNTPYMPQSWVYGVLAAQTVLTFTLSATLGKDWLVMFVYVAVACGAALPGTQSRFAIPAVTAALAGVGAWVDSSGDLYPALVIPALLGGFAMVGVRQLVRTMRELREARETVAHLAATEERLRLARDLHDLLGHSLSLITLKSELAGRMLPDRPQDAAQQVADIENVSRQALVDVREAVSGYRRPRLDAELASARSALASAGIAARIHQPERLPGLTPDGEGALAWALREAVTNVVRHSGAVTCVIALGATPDGEGAALTVSDDGRGPAAGHSPGNGLTGLTERLILAGGTLRTERAGDGGFRLTATVPMGADRTASSTGTRPTPP
ncbi:two-component system, NarL family, sensor histidine kinase DesK [Actinacidiphila alni]|uniref:Two-component system, NarL family, sensor histidine kinase DesK n=2 Tax=Actinacidiphila alni TaxID=380248 RepID=A0A1I2L3A6_9ACTN|nr:two-component system, NarL family, sensor histidine kinase DesK [Actinacidiphila alni]